MDLLEDGWRELDVVDIQLWGKLREVVSRLGFLNGFAMVPDVELDKVHQTGLVAADAVAQDAELGGVWVDRGHVRFEKVDGLQPASQRVLFLSR